MQTRIFKVVSEEIGACQPFRTERAMEEFLINNPLILGSISKDEDDTTLPAIIISQQEVLQPERKGETKRLDILALVYERNQYTLKMFELKDKMATRRNGFEQLSVYIYKSRENETFTSRISGSIREKVPSLKLPSELIERTSGVLVAPEFDFSMHYNKPQDDLLRTVFDWNQKNKRNPIELLKLTRYKTKSNEYIVTADYILSVSSKEVGVYDKAIHVKGKSGREYEMVRFKLSDGQYRYEVYENDRQVVAKDAFKDYLKAVGDTKNYGNTRRFGAAVFSKIRSKL